MPQAKLRLDIPDRVWIGELTRAFPDATFRILAALSDQEAGVGLAQLRSPRYPDIVARMNEAEDVTAVEVLQHSDTEALVQFETTMPLLLLPARDSGVPLEMPFDVADGEAVWEVTAPNDRLSALGDQLDAFDISYAVEFVQQRLTDEQLLTERQRRLVAAAVEAGYYDTPRDCSLTELASDLDIAKSTASETLHRAEGTIVKQYAESQVDPD